MVLRDRLMEAMGTLGLYGMKATFDEVLAAGIKSRATPEKILLDLLETELAERKVRSIRYRMNLAKFPVDKGLDQFEFTETPINEMQVRHRLRRQLPLGSHQRHHGRRHRFRQNTPRHSDCQAEYPERRESQILQCAGSGKSA